MSSSASQESLFSLLPETRTPWTEFVFGTGDAGTGGCASDLGALAVSRDRHRLRDAHFRSIRSGKHSGSRQSSAAAASDCQKPVAGRQSGSACERIAPSRATAESSRESEKDAPAPAVTIAPQETGTAPSRLRARHSQTGGENQRIFHRQFGHSNHCARAPRKCRPEASAIPMECLPKRIKAKPSTSQRWDRSICPSGPGYGNGTGGAKGARWRGCKFRIWQRHSHCRQPASHSSFNRSTQRFRPAPMFLLHRPCGRTRQKPQPGQCLRKSFPSQLPSILKKLAVCGSKAKFSWKWFWRPPATSVSCASCADWVTASTTTPSGPPNRFISSRR